MRTPRIFLWAWLTVGAATLVHDGLTGGGLLGLLLYRQLVDTHAIEPGLTFAGLLTVLVFIPGFLLAPRRRFRGPPAAVDPNAPKWPRLASLAACGALAGLAAFAWIEAGSAPRPDSPIARIDVASLAQGVRPPRGSRVVVRGVPCDSMAVSYDEVTPGGRSGHSYSTSHHFSPVTDGSCPPGRPVTVIADLNYVPGLPDNIAAEVHGLETGPQALYAAEEDLGPGVLIAHAAPDYLRAAFATRGVTLARDVWLYTPNVGAARSGWEIAAVVSGGAAVFALFCALVLGGGSARD